MENSKEQRSPARPVRSARIMLQAALALIVIFIIDLFIPLGIAISVLYVFCFYLVCGEDRKTIFSFALITSLLTMLKLFIFWSPDLGQPALVNRGLTILAILIIAIVAAHNRKLIERQEAERNRYIQELQRMLFLTSHKVRQPVASCLGLMDIVANEDHPLSQSDLHKVIGHLKASAVELDVFTRELALFIEEIKKENESRSSF